MGQQAGGTMPLGLGEGRVPRGMHVCCVFGDDDERFRVLARYCRAGFEDGDKLLYITDVLSPEEVHRRFADLGTDLGPATRSRLLSSSEGYYPDGSFRPEALIGYLIDFYRGALKEGFAGARATGEMSWAQRSVPGSERLLEYEVMLNDLFERAPLTALCQYDARLFDGATILSVLEIHPFLLVNGQILRNPNYARSDEIWRRLRAAAAAAAV